MEDRIAPLIAERAPWLFEEGPVRRQCRTVLEHLLQYPQTIELAKELEPLGALQIFEEMGQRLKPTLQITGLHNLPRSGPGLIMANHPTGIADAIILFEAIKHIRRDVFFLANSDLLRVFPQFEDMIVPVEWRTERRNRAKSRQTLIGFKREIEAGKLGIIFPSGRLAKRQHLHLVERPWMPSSVTLARKFNLPITPINLQWRNSNLFYILDIIHPTLRDITLFHETLNKEEQHCGVSIGKQIDRTDLPECPDAATEWVAKTVAGLSAKPVKPSVFDKLRAANADV